jgi:putative hydroxymethylpyrimidine transport system substrate-binding protein
MRRTLAAAGLLLAALALSACGAKTDQINPIASRAQPIGLELDWLPNADHVGLYEAQANGDFRRAGLDVQLHVPTDPASPLSLLESGKVQVAISYEPQVMLARNQGAYIVAFGALTQRPLTSIISVGKKHITSPADLRGKTVGTAGIPYQKAYLDTILKHSHVPVSSVKQVNVGSNLVPAMISGRVDATLGGYNNVEGVELRQAHQKPNIIPVAQAGVPDYDELVLVTTETFFANHTNELRRLVQAIGRGYEAVRSDPAAGVKALDDANPSLNPTFEAASVKASLPAFFPAKGKPFGWQVQSQWNAYGRWMTNHHLIAGPQAWAAASTNQLLAGVGP